MPAVTCEADLYAPVKAYFEGMGFLVRGEVCKCDAVAHRDGTLVAVEMKLAFGLPVIYQALERLSSVDLVYVATAVPDGRKARTNWDARAPDAVRLCRMLGVGLLAVRDGIVDILAEPAPYQPRKQPRKRARLLSELSRRTGDHNCGGTTRRPRVTAYREDALRCARVLARNGGAMKAADVRKGTGFTKAAALLRRNVYGWFENPERGMYMIADAGIAALADYADVIAAQDAASRRADAAGGAAHATA